MAEITEAPAYHGSKHEFTEFSVDHVGTGYGLQQYGWGVYLTNSKIVARRYKEKNGVIYHVDMPPTDHMLDWETKLGAQNAFVQDAIRKCGYPQMREKAMAEEVVTGYDGDYLDDPGEAIYGLIVSLQEWDASNPGNRIDQKAASLILAKAGITGIKYLDYKSGDQGHTNYVIFDPKCIRIEKVTKS